MAVGRGRSPSVGRISEAARGSRRTRSRPERSSNVRPPSSRSSSRTPSTPRRAASPSPTEYGGKKLIRVEDDGVGMDAGGRATQPGAARHQQDSPRRRPRRHRDARIPRRGAALDGVGVALPDADARAGRGERHGDSRERRRPGVGGRGRRTRRNARRGGGPLLQPAGAAQVPQVGRRRERSGLQDGHPAGPLLSAGRLHPRERRAQSALVPAGRLGLRTGCTSSTATGPISWR